MKIFEFKPTYLIRLNIKKQGEKTEHITLCETNPKEVYDWVTSIIEKQKISPLIKGRVTTIEIRESINGKNGKSTSISFKGIEPVRVKELLINIISNNENRRK